MADSSREARGEVPVPDRTFDESDEVEHPPHYGGEDNPYEVWKVAEAWGLDHDAYLFNVVKYIARRNKKGDPLVNLKKAREYLNRRIMLMESES